jgi:nucleoside-diphosphate-sugar epimerase
VRERLAAAGVETIGCDLTSRADVARLPDAAAVFFLAGSKFGTTGGEARTWATNCYAAALAAERYAGVPTVAFSTGNVYPLVAVESGGAREDTAPAPIGEYAQSALGRERLFEFFSRERGTPLVVFRLNYAVELRYGVLVDLARKVAAGVPIDLATGHLNCIWQGDANALALCSLPLARTPPFVLNVTGPETLSVRGLAEQLGERLARKPVFAGSEQPTALLSNAALASELFGAPPVSLEQMIAWVADWVRRGGATLDKPTHFEVRDGRF